MVVEKNSRTVLGSRKIFTCAEIEAKSLKKTAIKSPRSSPKVSNLKLIDSAVMQFSERRFTRYQRLELMALKDSKSSQSPPWCQYDPKIIRLNILKYKQDHTDDYENKLKTFRDLLPNLSLSHVVDPKLMGLLNNYHISLMNPEQNQSVTDNNQRQLSSLDIQQNNNRRVSWKVDEKLVGESQYENLQPYDRKNFFDSITTNTTMRHPPLMGVGSKYRQPIEAQKQMIRSAKGNSCSSERNNFYPNNVSTGSVSMNETNSSHNESMDKPREKFGDGFKHRYDSTDKGQADETEPEWFSFPASRHDVIDLHGFEDEESLHPNTPLSTDGSERPSSRNSPNSMVFDDFLRYNQKSEVSSKGNGSDIRRSNQNQNKRYAMDHTSNYYPRYRNPLHHSKSSSSFNSSENRSDFNNLSGTPCFNDGGSINPFFEQWKAANLTSSSNVPPENINFLNWMNTAGSMMTIGDVEHAMKQNGNPYGQLFNQQRHYRNQSVPQFFQIASDSTRLSGGGYNNPLIAGPSSYGPSRQSSMPTQEQLQQHTSEIMRNAILRKQFNNGRKFPK